MSHTDQVPQKPPKPKDQPAREDRSKNADAGAAPEQSDRQTAPGEPDDTPDEADDSRKSVDPHRKH